MSNRAVCPLVKHVYRVVESWNSFNSYQEYLFVAYVGTGFFFLTHFLCMTEGFMAMNVFVITGQIAAASLEMMAMQHYANLPFAKPAQLSEHRLKSALLTLAERK
jgi:hypothetical protein